MIGPHEGIEADLLISGVKPVGLFCLPRFPADFTTIEGDVFDTIGNDINRLDNFWANGQLLKEAIDMPPMSNWLGYPGTAHFYAQLNQKAALVRVMDILSAHWESKQPPKDQSKLGLYLGYKEQDVQLFNRGGYNSCNPFVQAFYKSTHSFRKACRLRSYQLKREPNSKMPSPTHDKLDR